MRVITKGVVSRIRLEMLFDVTLDLFSTRNIGKLDLTHVLDWVSTTALKQ